MNDVLSADVRLEKVLRIRKALDEGTYQVDIASLADRLIALANKLNREPLSGSNLVH